MRECMQGCRPDLRGPVLHRTADVLDRLWPLRTQTTLVDQQCTTWYIFFLTANWETPMDAFAARLRADRRNAGLTVRQLANQSQVSFSYITKIETGRAGSGISPEIISALAKALGRDELEYLYLSDVVPSPLNGLLADERFRSFVRTLLGTRSKSEAWDRLEAALAESKAEHSVSRKKSRRKSVA